MDTAVAEYQVIKSIGTSGQISLGKEHAGRKVLVENPEPGVWVIRTVTIIPDNERWLHESVIKKNLDKAVAWASKNAAKESSTDDLKLKKTHGSKREKNST